MELKTLGARVLHGVNVKRMKLHTDLKNRRFDRVIFNFPHAGFRGRETEVHVIKYVWLFLKKKYVWLLFSLHIWTGCMVICLVVPTKELIRKPMHMSNQANGNGYHDYKLFSFKFILGTVDH